MNPRSFGKFIFILTPIFMALAFIVNMFMYNECKKDGYSTFACFSMLQKGQYIIVDEMDGRP